MNTIIDEFISRYTREYDYYLQIARHCSETCERELEQSGIRAIVSYRAKRFDRLRKKLENRDAAKHYVSVDDIYQDIPDLAGVRIALYFPADRDEIRKIIETNFDVHHVKQFPAESKYTYQKRFHGYVACHFRVRLKEALLSEKDKHRCLSPIEIQVASVLMHGWSEVEHDLIYKPLSGTLSNEEYQILDQLNGLVITGESLLDSLQSAVKSRVTKSDEKFHSHYELAAFLDGTLRRRNPDMQHDLSMGRVDVLFNFLQRANLDAAEGLEKYLPSLHTDTDKISLDRQLVDAILGDNQDLLQVYKQSKNDVGSKNPYESTEPPSDDKAQYVYGQLIAAFSVLNTCVETYLDVPSALVNVKDNIFAGKIKALVDRKILPDDYYPLLMHAQYVRNVIVHDDIRNTEADNPDSVVRFVGVVIDAIQLILPHLMEGAQEFTKRFLAHSESW